MTIDNQIDTFARGSEAQPQAASTPTSVQIRSDQYGNVIVAPTLSAASRQALDGNYFVASSATPGTSIATSITTAFDATAGILSIYNGGTKDLVLDFIKMIAETAPASATAMHLASFLDNSNRVASGNTGLTPKNVYGGTGTLASQTAADVTVDVGALVFNAASASQRRVGRMIARSVIPVVKDELIIAFGKDILTGGDDLGGTVAKRHIIPHVPVVIPTGWSYLINHWLPSNASTAGKFEFEVGFYKR